MDHIPQVPGGAMLHSGVTSQRMSIRSIAIREANPALENTGGPDAAPLSDASHSSTPGAAMTASPLVFGVLLLIAGTVVGLRSAAPHRDTLLPTAQRPRGAPASLCRVTSGGL